MKSHILSLFFTFLGNPPLKIFKSELWPLHSPSHHEHPTTVLPTGWPTRWCWFYCDWMSLIRMISYHGYQNCLSHHFKAILRPLHPTSQDKTHTTMLPRRCPTRPYEYHGQLRRFPKKEIVGLLTKFQFPKRRPKPWKREVHLLEIIFSETCRHVIPFYKVRKWSSLTTTPS